MSRQPASGFVLIGVVMFVLALTILGLSLYSLSNYEAEFLGQAHDQKSALYRAQGGLDMVKAAISESPFSLGAASSVMGIEGVTYARAYQRRSNGTLDSAGTMNWDSLVTVTVSAGDGPESRTLRATFSPASRRSLYKRLYTTSGTTVKFNPGGGLQSHPGGVYIDNPVGAIRMQDVNSRVWQNTADSSWRERVLWPSPRPSLRVGGVPPPDVQGYYAAHPALLEPTYFGGGGGGGGGNLLGGGDGTDPPGGGGGGGDIVVQFLDHVSSGPNNVGYYHYIPDFKSADYSFDTDINTHAIVLEVRGTTVWELPSGMNVYQRLTIRRGGDPGTNPTLVIVASKNPLRGPGTDPDIGICLLGGLVIEDHVNVIFASDGRVDLEQDQNYDQSFTADRLSIYATSLSMGGPHAGDVSTLDYDSSMDTIIDVLEAADRLPHGTGSPPARGFALVRGSWQDLTP